ncbi:MAG: hypothetical protein ACPG5B_16730 [Chitinophagales bacterium]
MKKNWFKRKFPKLWRFFHSLNGKKIEQAIWDAVKLVEQIKKLVNSDYIEWLTNMTNGKTDDKLIAFLRQFIPHFHQLLKDHVKFGACFRSDGTDLEKLICIFDTLQYIKNNQNGYFKTLLKDIAKLISKTKNAKLDDNTLDDDIEVAYRQIRK